MLVRSIRCLSWMLLAAVAWLAIAAPRTESESITAGDDTGFVSGLVLEQRDFPFLAKLLQDAPVSEALARDPVLGALARAKQAQIAAALHTCNGVASCEATPLIFTADEEQAVARELARLYAASPAVRAFTARDLTPIERFDLNAKAAGATLLSDAWMRSAAGIDVIVKRYGDGKAPRYKQIDAGIYAIDSPNYGRLVETILESIAGSAENPPRPVPQPDLFFEPSLRFSLRLLEANSLDQAGRFWPLRSGENAAAIGQVSAVHWPAYRYTVIVVPGEGPDSLDVPISAWGKERVGLAVEAYRSGEAPFILVSGGFVHPPHTRFCEAIEMKRYLEQAYGIPSAAILVDPYARHTTTNLRNAVREIADYGIPFNRPFLIVSDRFQIDYIMSQRFAARCNRELGYQPAILEKRTSQTEIAALPSRRSLFTDPTDPLDP